MKGNSEVVKRTLLAWFEQFNTSIEWISDVCHYDFVLLIDLLYGCALDMPYPSRSASCHDINQDIAKHFNVSEIVAFDMYREGILNRLKVEAIEGDKHNALYDAKVIKALYEKLSESDSKVLRQRDALKDFVLEIADEVLKEIDKDGWCRLVIEKEKAEEMKQFISEL